MKILLVDDEADIVDVYKRGLERANYRVHSAQTVSEATAHIQKESPFSILITDYNLDEGTGLELATVFGQHNPNAKVFVMSGEIIDKKSLGPELENIDIEFLLKPFSKKDLLKKIA